MRIIYNNIQMKILILSLIVPITMKIKSYPRNFVKKIKLLMFLFLLTQLRGFIFLKIIKKIQQVALPVYFHKQISIIDV